MTTLEMLDHLGDTLSSLSTRDEHAKAWDLVLSVESDLDRDPRSPAVERDHMRRIRQGVSEIIAARNKGLNAVPSLALIPIGALASSIRSRTIGIDGWPRG